MLPLDWSPVRHAVLRALARDVALPSHQRVICYHVTCVGHRQHGLGAQYRALRRDPTQDAAERPFRLQPVGSAEGQVLFAAWRHKLLTVAAPTVGADPQPFGLTQLGYQSLAAWDQRRSRQRRTANEKPGSLALDEAMARIYVEYGDALRRLGKL